MTKMHPNVDDAANQLPEEAREVFKEAFYHCMVLDLYDGNLQMYLTIISQTIRDDKKKLQTLKEAISSCRKALEIS